MVFETLLTCMVARKEAVSGSKEGARRRRCERTAWRESVKYMVVEDGIEPPTRQFSTALGFH
jgi:hypothetical protein